jgi:hypothetical protein
VSYVRLRDRVTITNPSPHHTHLTGLRGTVNYVEDNAVLLDLDNGDQVLLWDSELLSDEDTDDRVMACAERVLAGFHTSQ